MQTTFVCKYENSNLNHRIKIQDGRDKTAKKNKAVFYAKKILPHTREPR